MGAASLRSRAIASRATAGQAARPAPSRPTCPDLRVDARALRERIEKLSTFGRPAGGTFADGVSRIAYSDADVEGRRYVMGLMTAAGLTAAHRSGRQHLRAGGPAPIARLPPILFGSHIDSVPNGGNFDGDLGLALGAWASSKRSHAADVRTRHPLEMVVWAHEEGFAFGRGLACSRIVAGDVAAADMDEVWNGMRRGDAIRQDRRRPGSDSRGAPAEGRAPLLPRAAHRAGRHARTRRASRSASSRASSRSTGTTRS